MQEGRRIYEREFAIGRTVEILVAMKDALVKLLGWKATILQGDPTVVDRWRWLKRHLQARPVADARRGLWHGGFHVLCRADRQSWRSGISFDPRQLQRRDGGQSSSASKASNFAKGTCVGSMK